MNKTVSHRKNLVFIDTSAWLMLMNQDETRHEEAVETYNELLINSAKVTSNMVISETYNWLRMRTGFKNALDFLTATCQMQNDKLLTIIWSSQVLEEKALRYLQKYQDHKLSFVDAVSFAIMAELKIKNSFSFDRHFNIAGFATVNSL